MNADTQSDSATSRTAPVSLRGAYKFFMPLIFMAELHMLSHAVITAFLARMPDPEPTLAAYSMAFYLHATLGSPVWAVQFVAISYIRDKASMRKLLIFSAQTFALVGWLWALISVTPFGLTFFKVVFGASDAVAIDAQRCILVSTLIVPFVFFRSLSYALLMIHRRTVFVTLGTFIRLLSLAVILYVLTRVTDGALVGIGALTACIGVESVYAVIAARKHYMQLPVQSEAPPTYRELWRFGWPVMLMQTAESGVAFMATFFLGRLPRPELAIAAFGVLDGMMRVLLGPLRNLTPAVQTLTQSRVDIGIMLKFAIQIALVFSLLMGVMQIGTVGRWTLESVMGLPPDMAAYVAPALSLSFVLALCMTASSFARGLLLSSRKTGAIAVSSVARIVAAGVVGAIALTMTEVNGAVVGMLSLIAAFATEALMLGMRVLQVERREHGLFRS
ncbi:MAG: O-antigen/teichoic acid export membrane protein [Gammaproteobacteria bacterium]|jgi:O-antigen/teichoic acid export membrane protein